MTFDEIINAIKVEPYYLDKEYGQAIYCSDCREVLPYIPDKSIDIIITSPPYNVGRWYNEERISDRKPYSDYLDFIRQVIAECYRVLISGGRVAVNVPSSILQSSCWRMSYLSLDFALILRGAGFLDREWITWIKMPRGGLPGKSTSWGSWKKASCPYLRDASEFILVMDKQSHKLLKQGESDIRTDEFLKFTTNCWYMKPETNRTHPAPFPEELPYRLMKLYTYKEALIIDPFLGRGTTAWVAKKQNRKCIGIDIEEKYCKMAKNRLAQSIMRLEE